MYIMNDIKKTTLQKVLDSPHLIGYMVGKTKLSDLHSYWIKYCWYPIEYFTANNNQQLKDMLNFFNNMGKTFDKEIAFRKVERQFLTEEKLLELLKNPKRSLKGHRGSYKSTAILAIGAIIRLLFNPDIRICMVQKDFTKASLWIKTISNMMKEPKIQQLFRLAHGVFPKTIKDSDSIVTFNFKKTMTPEGNLNAFGVHQNMIGKHFDLIQADDFISIDDKISKAERDKTKLHLEDITNNILDRGCSMIYTGTVWHPDDAWSICPDALIFDYHITGIMTEEEKRNLKEGKTKLTKTMLAANYELSHLPSDEQMFKDANWAEWDKLQHSGIYGHLDAKYSGSDTNGLTFFYKKPNGKIQGVGFCFHEHIEDKMSYVIQKYKKYFCGKLYLEDNGDKGYLAKEFNKLGIKTESYHESMNKHIKIENYLYPIWDDIEWDPETDPEYISMILDYQEGAEPDDCPDSASSLIREHFYDGGKNMDRWRW